MPLFSFYWHLMCCELIKVSAPSDTWRAATNNYFHYQLICGLFSSIHQLIYCVTKLCKMAISFSEVLQGDLLRCLVFVRPTVQSLKIFGLLTDMTENTGKSFTLEKMERTVFGIFQVNMCCIGEQNNQKGFCCSCRIVLLPDPAVFSESSGVSGNSFTSPGTGEVVFRDCCLLCL